MSETKQVPLSLPREVGGHVWLIELPGQGITIADKTMAFNLVNRYNAHERLEADSKKLREPATCNAGHKSNLPLALWDCPVCTQLLRDKLQQLLGAAKPFVFDRPRHSKDEFAKLEEAIREVEPALKGSPADTNSHEVRKARGAQ